MSHYFLSYARADAEFALRLADDLRTAGVNLWVDQRDIRPSQRWDRAVENALRDCAAVVVVLSPRSVASENVLDEVGFAMDHRRDVIPVLLEPCDIPIRISRLQHIDFAGGYQPALERCRRVLGTLPNGSKRPLDPELVQRAREELTLYIGTLAGQLTDIDAMQARDVGELYRLLASHILNPAKKAAFLRNAPSDAGGRPTAASTPLPIFEQTLLDTVTFELTKVLGPISTHLVKQASGKAMNRADLYERVASHVSNAQERAKLLERLPTH